MLDYVDEICLLLACCLAALIHPSEPLMISGFLMGIIAACSESIASMPIRLAIQAACVATCCLWLPFLCFLPLAAYALMHERNWPLRILWVVPICIQWALGAPWQALAWVTSLCAVACLLAVRDIRSESEHASLQRAYDLLREQTFARDEEAHGASDGSDGGPAAQTDRYEPTFFEGLTKRELAVVHLVAEGMDNREISQMLFLSEGTVRNHISSILSKKDLRNRTQIAVMYYRG